MVTEQTTETRSLSREEIIRRLKDLDRGYSFVDDQIHFEPSKKSNAGFVETASVRYNLGYFGCDKPGVRFIPENPSQIIYAQRLYQQLRQMGVDDVLNVPVGEKGISEMRSAADTLGHVANVLEFQNKQTGSR